VGPALQVRACDLHRLPRPREHWARHLCCSTTSFAIDLNCIEIEITLRLDGENVNDIRAMQVKSLLTEQLGERDDRFTVTVEQDIPYIVHCTIHPRNNLETILRMSV
jgi:hypothetical protein